MLSLRPIHQVIGQVDDALGRPARVRQLLALHASPGDESAQILRVGSGKGLINRLVGIAHPHPVTARSGEQPEDLFLEQAAILRLILQDVRPTITQALEQPLIQLEGIQGQPDQVIEIHRSAIDQRSLVIAVDLPAHLCQGQWEGKFRQALSQFFGGETLILGVADETQPDIPDQIRQVLAIHPGNTVLIQVGIEIASQLIQVAVQPGLRGLLANL